MKIYKDSRTGISSQVLRAGHDDDFNITGPYGKGVDARSGSIIVWAGGTGILPFMDLFAYFARQILQKNSPKYSVFENEILNELDENIDFSVFVHLFIPKKLKKQKLQSILNRPISLLYSVSGCV